MSKVRVYGTITKIEEQPDGSLHVEGVASSEVQDSQGETVLAAGMAKAIPEYMRFPALREMHTAWAAGKTTSAEVGDDKVTRIATKVVDAEAVKKVKEGVYAGFSIGGKVTKRSASDPKVIEELELTEISLVDRPANPDAVFQLVKLDQEPTMAKCKCGAHEVEAGKTLHEDGRNIDHAEKACIALNVAKAAPAKAEPVAKVDAPPPPAAPASPPAAAAEPASKAEGTAAAATGEALKKGMYQVGWAAELCDSLASLASSAQWEADFEGDASGVPGKLKAVCAGMCDALRDLVAEETAELMAGMPAGTTVEVAMAQKPGSLKKTERLGGIAKAFMAGISGETVEKKGARFSRKTKGALQDHEEALGKCREALGKCHDVFKDTLTEALDQEDDSASGDDVAAATKTSGLEKRATEAEDAVAKAGAALKKVLEERDALAQQLAEAKVRLETKGALRAVPVEKGQDTGTAKVEEQLPPTTDPIELAKRAVKQVHRAGGRPLA